tara:strand:+ start:20315 stop:20512 length:198 start_codon:yes stop_codon:yes gene_type:complete
MMEVITEYIPWLLSGVLTVAGYLFKNKYQQLKKTVDVFTKMWEDDKVTQEEWKEFVDEAKKLIGK